jgi:ABC-type polysaccharide transport system, permease component
MYGVQIAFRDYSPTIGILGSKWIWFEQFKLFFKGFYFKQTLGNTLLISFYDILFGFPAPIILAFLLNEVRNKHFKRCVQTFTYLPHFISLVVVVGLLYNILSPGGLVNNLLNSFGKESIPFLAKPEWFRPLYVGTNIWQSVGWQSIIYMAAICNIDQTLYEAAYIDGAGKLRQLWNITLPGIVPTIVIMFILRMGNVMGVPPDKIILMYTPLTYQTADVINTYVYRKGLLEASYSYSAAVGLFNSVINFIFLYTTNKICRSVSDSGLW